VFEAIYWTWQIFAWKFKVNFCSEQIIIWKFAKLETIGVTNYHVISYQKFASIENSVFFFDKNQLEKPQILAKYVAQYLHNTVIHINLQVNHLRLNKTWIFGNDITTLMNILDACVMYSVLFALNTRYFYNKSSLNVPVLAWYLIVFD